MTPQQIKLALMGIDAGGNILSGIFGGNEMEEQAKILLQGQREQQEFMDQGYQDASDLTRGIRDQGMAGFDRLAQGTLHGDYNLPELGNYQFDGDINQYLDPSRKFQQQEILRGLEGSQAYGGKLKSGASMEALQDRMQDRSMLDWGNAQGLMRNDRNFGYQDWINQFNSKTASINDEYAKLQNLANTGVKSTQNLADNRIQQGMAQGQGAMNSAGIMAQSASAPYNNIQNVIGAGQDLLGGAIGAYGADSPSIQQQDYTGSMGMKNFDNNAIKQFNQQQNNPYNLMGGGVNTGNL
jgi:hypothetical protein